MSMMILVVGCQHRIVSKHLVSENTTNKITKSITSRRINLIKITVNIRIRKMSLINRNRYPINIINQRRLTCLNNFREKMIMSYMNRTKKLHRSKSKILS